MSLAEAKPTIETPRAINTALNFDNEWTPEEYLEILYHRLPCAVGYDERARIQARIDTVEICFAGRETNDPAWLEFREWFVC